MRGTLYFRNVIVSRTPESNILDSYFSNSCWIWWNDSLGSEMEFKIKQNVHFVILEVKKINNNGLAFFAWTTCIGEHWVTKDITGKCELENQIIELIDNI